MNFKTLLAVCKFSPFPAAEVGHAVNTISSLPIPLVRNKWSLNRRSDKANREVVKCGFIIVLPIGHDDCRNAYFTAQLNEVVCDNITTSLTPYYD